MLRPLLVAPMVIMSLTAPSVNTTRHRASNDGNPPAKRRVEPKRPLRAQERSHRRLQDCRWTRPMRLAQISLVAPAPGTRTDEDTTQCTSRTVPGLHSSSDQHADTDEARKVRPREDRHTARRL